METRSRSRIYYSPEYPELIFALAVFLRSLMDEITLVPANLKHLLENPPLSGEDAYVLNLYPKNDSEKNQLKQFFKDYGGQIEFWFDNHPWDKEQIDNFNHDKNIIYCYRGPSCLEIMLELSYEPQLDWFDLALQLAHPEDWKKNKLTRRYRRAYYAAKICSQNLRTDDVADFFKLAAQELAFNIPMEMSQAWFNDYEIIQKNTQLAKNKVGLSSPVIGLENNSGEKIGYADLGEVNHLIDLNEVIATGREKFPWLFVLQYGYADQEYTGIFSKKFKVRKKLEIKHNVINMPRDKAISFLKTRIAYW